MSELDEVEQLGSVPWLGDAMVRPRCIHEMLERHRRLHDTTIDEHDGDSAHDALGMIVGYRVDEGDLNRWEIVVQGVRKNYPGLTGMRREVDMCLLDPRLDVWGKLNDSTHTRRVGVAPIRRLHCGLCEDTKEVVGGRRKRRLGRYEPASSCSLSYPAAIEVAISYNDSRAVVWLDIAVTIIRYVLWLSRYGDGVVVGKLDFRGEDQRKARDTVR